MTIGDEDGSYPLTYKAINLSVALSLIHCHITKDAGNHMITM
jgi:hypothetical protein